MKFTPLTNEQLQSLNLLEKGIYHFEVVEATDTISRANNEMIKLKLKIWDRDGNEHCIFDYLAESMAAKLRHFCEYTFQLPTYESGTLMASDCIRKMGKVIIDIKKGTARPEGGFYPDRNVVKDYSRELATGGGLVSATLPTDIPTDDE